MLLKMMQKLTNLYHFLDSVSCLHLENFRNDDTRVVMSLHRKSGLSLDYYLRNLDSVSEVNLELFPEQTVSHYSN